MDHDEGEGDDQVEQKPDVYHLDIRGRGEGIADLVKCENYQQTFIRYI